MARAVDRIDHHGEGCRRREREVAAIAAEQHGVVSRRQLLELGYGDAAFRYRVRVGRLHRVCPGVLAVGHACVTGRGRLKAATLSCGERAVLSHQSGAWLQGIQPDAREIIDVSVAGAGPRSRPGVRLHRRRMLHPDDRTQVEGIPVTSVARTLRDLAAVLPRRRLERAFEEAERLRIFDLRALAAVGERQRGRRGARAVADLLQSRFKPLWTRSELERRALELCAEEGLDKPVLNGLVHGFEVDLHWPGTRLIVELDGYRFHHTRAAFERDRARDAALHAAGHIVLRLTQQRLEEDARGAMRQVRVLLDA